MELVGLHLLLSYLSFVCVWPDFSDNEKECVIVWEKKPTVEEKAKADTLKLPPTFFVASAVTLMRTMEMEDFQSEPQKVQEAQVRLSLAFLLIQSPC